MNMTSSSPDSDILISAPTVLPFISPDAMRCPACGTGPVSTLVQVSRTIWGKLPITPWTIHYCAGGKEPTEQVALGPLFATERQHSCAGVGVPHLHVRCNRCQCETLTQTKMGGRR